MGDVLPWRIWSRPVADFPDLDGPIYLLQRVRTSVRDDAFASFMQELDGDGVLLWNFQGHANKFFLTHEEVFRDRDAFGRSIGTSEAIENRRPPVPVPRLGVPSLAEFDRAGDELAQRDCVCPRS